MLMRTLNDVLYWFGTLQPQHWVMVLAGVIFIGYFCMKGVGSRSHY